MPTPDPTLFSDEVVLAHAGGWDELLLIGVPVALFVLFRWLAIRKEEREADRETEPD